MQLPRLTPLQSRLLASVIATVLLVGVWLSFRPANFVYAAEIASAPQDAGHALFGQAIPLEEEHRGDLAGREAESSDTRGGYLGDFAYFDESLVGRADEPVGELVLDQTSETDLTPRNTKNFVVKKAQFSVKRGEDGDDELESVDQRGGNNASKRRTDVDSAHLEEDEGEEQMAGIQKRQSQKTLYFSVTTCRQPMPMMHTTDDPLQLTLYISNDTRNQKPGPKSKDHLATPPISLVDGYAKFALNSTSDVYLGIDAPGLEKDWNGSYHFQIAASTVDFYHKVDNEHSFAYKVDTDSGAALFITHNFTDNSASVEKWKTVQGENIPFRMYAFENATWGARGLTRSLCGLQNAFQSGNSSININTTMIAQYGEPLPKAQFHVQGLKANTTYTGMVAIAGNMPLDGLDFGEMKVPKGGQVWTQFNWTTKDDDTCQVIFNLPFCSEIAHAVPSSPEFKNKPAELGAKYDTYASDLMTNFSNSLAQIPCNATDTAQYSLASTCTDCANSYKTWLCAVLMPRCEPFSTNSTLRPELVERAVNSSFPASDPNNKTYAYPADDPRRMRFATARSRNPFIDEEIHPGPYKELLPCEDLCFDLVRTCPATLGFACPNRQGMNASYAKRSGDERLLGCNFPGAVVNLNVKPSAGNRVGSVGVMGVVAVSVVVGLGLGW